MAKSRNKARVSSDEEFIAVLDLIIDDFDQKVTDHKTKLAALRKSMEEAADEPTHAQGTPSHP